MNEGVCIVISPLIALMKDQVYHLRQKGIEAAAIYSGMHYIEIDRILDNAVHGNLKLLYLSPERLQTEIAIARIQQMKVNLIAVDEAHCISQWGYDFRPPYLLIAKIKNFLPKTPILALTATATEEVILDIQSRLEMNDAQIFKKSFLRKNLAYVVLFEENKEKKLLEILQKVGGSGIVYVRNRKKCKDIALWLSTNNISADYYHAGLNHEERSTKQDKWMTNKTRIIVCTNAFGMGIDKPDVRVVVHIDLPNNLEDYFQEAGRAGRDGNKSFVTLLYNASDRYALEESYRLAFPALEVVKSTYKALGNYFQLAIGSGEGESFDFDITAFSKRYKIEPILSLSSLKVLEQSGWITLSDSVFIPSTVQVIVSRDNLYDLVLKNPSYNLVIQALLRVHHGIFLHPIALNEHKLAKHIKKDVTYVYKMLTILDRDNLIKYIPQKDSPQITFLKERVDNSNLSIDIVAYNFRKNRAYERMKKVIQYAETIKCRNVQLLSYFGEITDNCGTCDVCLGRTKVNITVEEYERYANKLIEIIHAEHCNIDVLLEYFSPRTHPLVLIVLQKLVEEDKIEKLDNLYQLKIVS